MAKTIEQWLSSNHTGGDIYHGCHVYPDGYALSQVLDERETPLTMYAHGTILNRYEDFNRGTQTRIRKALDRSSHVLCSSKAVEKKATEIVSEAKTDVVPIGADPKNFPTDREPLLREELNVPADATVVLYCGQFSKQKGVHDLLTVLSDLEDDSLYVVFIGHGGELRTEIQDVLGETTTPSGRVLWNLSPVAVRRWFAVADLFVLPSYSEGRSTVIYEAMASETPVLATTVGGIPEQVVDGQTGRLFEPGDTDTLQATIESLQTEELATMGQEGKVRLIDNGWTWEAHAERIIDRHRSLLQS